VSHDADESCPTGDDDELFLAVGRAVSAGGTLEWSITDLHGTLLQSPRGLHAVAGEGVDRARAGCLEMASLIGSPVEDLVREVLLPVKALWDQRNALVHGAWLADSHLGDPGRSGITLRLRRSGMAMEGWSTTSINKLTAELSLYAERITALEQRLRDEPELAQLLAVQPAPFQLGVTKVW
jgi:hypothetical protein